MYATTTELAAFAVYTVFVIALCTWGYFTLVIHFRFLILLAESIFFSM